MSLTNLQVTKSPYISPSPAPPEIQEKVDVTVHEWQDEEKQRKRHEEDEKRNIEEEQIMNVVSADFPCTCITASTCTHGFVAYLRESLYSPAKACDDSDHGRGGL